MTRFTVGPNQLWPFDGIVESIGCERKRLFDKGSKIFTLGSCFARAMRAELTELGYDVYPKYRSLELKPGQRAGRLPERDNIHQYTPQQMRQELVQAKTGEWYDETWQQPDGLWADPCRRSVYGDSADSIYDLRSRINEMMRDAYEQCDVVLLTFGLIETWYIDDGWFASGYGAIDGEPYASRLRFSADVIEADDAVGATIDACEGKTVVASVSPVPLRRTYTSEDVVVANCMSKSTLRAAVGDICRHSPGVTYWPAYEYMLCNPQMWESREHPTKGAVKEIVQAFVQAHG